MASPLLSIICRHTLLQRYGLYYAPPNHTAQYRTVTGLWVPGPAHGIVESRGGRPSNPTHKLYSPFPDRVTWSGFSSRCRTFISACNQPSKPTQPGHPFVGRRNEYQPWR